MGGYLELEVHIRCAVSSGYKIVPTIHRNCSTPKLHTRHPVVSWCAIHLKECQASKVAQVVPSALCEEKVVVHGCQALPGNQVQVVLIPVAEAQLRHHCSIERGVLLVEPACSILLHQNTPASNYYHMHCR